MAKDKWEINKESSVSETEARRSLRIVRSVYAFLVLGGGAGLFALWRILPPEGQITLLAFAGIVTIVLLALRFGEDVVDFIAEAVWSFNDHRDNLRVAKHSGVNDE